MKEFDIDDATADRLLLLARASGFIDVESWLRHESSMVLGTKDVDKVVMLGGTQRNMYHEWMGVLYENIRQILSEGRIQKTEDRNLTSGFGLLSSLCG